MSRANHLPKYAEQAASLCKNFAEKGDPEACYKLGIMYATGDGVPKDPLEAALWLSKAGEALDAEEQYDLAKKTNYDSLQSTFWYQKAAVKGHGGAQWELGTDYTSSKDFMQAAYWYHKSAEQLGIKAREAYSLGERYASGSGVNKNLNKAVRHFLEATQFARLRGKSYYYLSLMYDEGTDLPRDPMQASLCRLIAAEQGFPEGERAFVYDSTYGHELPQNPARAIAWYQQLTGDGHVQQVQELSHRYYETGIRYLEGDGVSRDMIQAGFWLCSAAALGSHTAYCTLRRLAAEPELDGLFELGWLYAVGERLPKNSEQARFWFTKAMAFAKQAPPSS